VIDLLLSEGYGVHALCRRAASLEPRQGLSIFEGQLSDAAVIDETVRGCRAALILFGPRPPHTDIFCAAATAAIVSAMARAGIRRLICQTGAMVGDYPRNRSWLLRLMRRIFDRYYPELGADRRQQEKAVIESGLDWTILKPPRLTDGAPAPIAMGPDVRVGMLSSVSRASIAGLVIRELGEDGHLHEIMFVKHRLS